MLWSESGVGEIGARCFVISGMFGQKVVWVKLVLGAWQSVVSLVRKWCGCHWYKVFGNQW